MADEKSGVEPEFDLFGNPLEPLKDPRGRKTYAKTKENQRLVVDLAASGMKQSAISTVLGCDEKTLRKYYSRELDEAAELVKAEAVSVMMRKMRMGNIAATKFVIETLAAQVPKAPKPARPAKEPEKGKKEKLAEAAAKPPSGWGGILGDEGPH